MRWAALQSATRQRWQAIATAFAAFVVVFALRLIDPNANDGVALLYVVPIAVLAAEFGLVGGLAAALVACGLVGIWIAVQDTGLTVAAFLTRATVFVTIGLVVGVAADRLRHALLERQDLLDEVSDRAQHFEISRDLLAMATFDGYFDRVNDRWENVLGWTKEELTSRPYTDFVHPDDVGSTDEETAALAEGGVTVEFVNRYRTKDGRWRWLEWNAVSVPERERVYGAARDITERRVAESESRRLASIVEFSNDAVITVSLDARITTWNPAAERMSGYSAEEAIGQLSRSSPRLTSPTPCPSSWRDLLPGPDPLDDPQGPDHPGGELPQRAHRHDHDRGAELRETRDHRRPRRQPQLSAPG